MAFKPLVFDNVSRETFNYTLQPRGCGKMYDEYTKERVKWAVKNGLNSIYGLQFQGFPDRVLHDVYLTGKALYADTDSIKVKENDMERLNIKDFIVLHKSGLPCLINKSRITTIEKNGDGSTMIWGDKNGADFVDEKYEDVIKRLFT